LIYGTLKVKDKDGKEELKSQTTAFCRCGASKTKPYCDGSHRKIGFED
jgi:CDGSH-type Zn-finger protein